MLRVSRATVLAALLVFVTCACDRGPSETDVPGAEPGSDTEAQAGQASSGGGRPLLQPEPTPGVYFRLRDAEPGAAEAVSGPRTVDGDPLPAEAVAERLSGLPDLPATEGLTTTLALRSGPRPPAVTGETRNAPWPPSEESGPPPEVPAGPVEVTRAGPEGDVPMAARMAVTFSEAMVPLTSHAQLEEEDLRVVLSPQVEGQWRWVGTKTLLFEPDFRFPQATEYSATISAGIESVRGATLDQSYAWTFRTPPAEVVRFVPGVPEGGQNHQLRIANRCWSPSSTRTWIPTQSSRRRGPRLTMAR